jgi:hypothetical protein
MTGSTRNGAARRTAHEARDQRVELYDLEVRRHREVVVGELLLVDLGDLHASLFDVLVVEGNDAEREVIEVGDRRDGRERRRLHQEIREVDPLDLLGEARLGVARLRGDLPDVAGVTDDRVLLAGVLDLRRVFGLSRRAGRAAAAGGLEAALRLVEVDDDRLLLRVDELPSGCSACSRRSW